MLMNIKNALRELQPEQFYLVYAIVALVLSLSALWFTSGKNFSASRKVINTLILLVDVTLVFYIIRWLHTDVHVAVAWIVTLLPLVFAIKWGNVLGNTLLSYYNNYLF
jgi:hypothetical protein